MNHKTGTGLIMMVFLLSLAGTCTAADSYGYLASLNGGKSTIVNDTRDMMIITVQNPDPYVNITKEDNTTSISDDLLQYAALPINAVVVFSTPETKSVSLVKIENLSISDNNDNLTLLVKPLDYYDGEILTPYAQDTVNLYELDKKTFNNAGLYLEMTKNIPENSFDSEPTCENCIADCHGYPPCISECDVVC